MKQARFVFTGWVAALAVAGLLAAACAWADSHAFDCTPEVTVAEGAQAAVALAGFVCSFEKYEGADVLHFKVTVKNIADAPQRYRVNIFLDNGKAVGGLIPRTTKKGLVNPGETADFVYPVTGMTEKPEKIEVMISTTAS
jgi:hypothetical protein